ncbi:MAG: DEAD/DEAH box helicase [Salinivirgaceae bacterium]
MTTTFTESGLRPELLSAIQEMGFEQPTPIQAKTIPFLLSSEQDLIGLAQTGTGKTAAFGLPALHLTEIENKQTQTLILCPTRELCLQIAKDLNDFAKHLKKINVVAVYGGASIETQIRDLNRGAQIVVGTPGRTRDLINRNRLKPNHIKRLILDEADEMLTMGFKEELDAILENTPDTKQTLLFSATMSREISRITSTYMNNPEQISVSGRNTAADNVTHIYYMVQAKDRYEVIKRIADINPDIYGIVFCRTRQEAKDVARKLMSDGYNADALHGDLSQAQRDEVMARFRTRQLQLLVATDVAARGIDVNDLTHVVNYNLPDDPEVYVHRSGRTGRAGKNGISVAIIHSRESRKIKDIERISGLKFNKEKVPNGRDICSAQLLSLIDRLDKVKVDEKEISPFLPEIYEKLEHMSREELIKNFVSAEFNRFLEYYRNARDVNVLESRRGEDRERPTRNKGRRSGDSGFSRLYINIGSTHNVTPARLIGVVNEALRSNNADIGKIEIMKKFSFFDIEDKLDDKLIRELQGKKFDGTPILVEKAARKDDRRSGGGGEASRGGASRGGATGAPRKRRAPGEKRKRR